MSYIIIIAVVLFDQLSKVLTLKYLAPIKDIPIIKNVFHLTYVENRGAAFGMLQNQKVFFVVTTIIILGAIYFYVRNNKPNRFLTISLSLIVGGALGNFIDRIRLGFVVDYFNFTLINFPVFNIADSAVVIGAFLVSIYIIKYDL
ncbi:signal peptidase II [Alkaliphilus oremlandii]|uniref:Lipoprotein signal peptidase n=1 Tax=Alkaliphilus oremlandii (strain OhILAs) TaxID=350688 RepID=A8MH73_ALKOO|nr:signal peptidase II [Alkaliphilus oremlandii]ABW18960.1 lipoprotein signal peptidase [Alkaliphilus oremlandii OhILAs]